MQAAQAAECASDQGRFWEYHDTLFDNWAGENEGAYSASNLMAFASHVDLDPEVFGACMVSGGGAERVQRDLEDADRLDVRSIPSVFINGVRLEGLRDYSVYRSAIEAELARQR